MEKQIEGTKIPSGVNISIPDSAIGPIKRVMMDSAVEAFKQIAVRESLPYWMKIGEAETYANVSPKTFKHFVESGLKVSVFGGVQRISKKSVDEFYDQFEM